MRLMKEEDEDRVIGVIAKSREEPEEKVGSD